MDKQKQPSTYEIYTCHPVTGETGWDIVHVETASDISLYPLFDCIITRNDSHGLFGQIPNLIKWEAI